MPKKGIKEPGVDSVAGYDNSAEVSEEDLKPGERRKGGQDVETE